MIKYRSVCVLCIICLLLQIAQSTIYSLHQLPDTIFIGDTIKFTESDCDHQDPRLIKLRANRFKNLIYNSMLVLKQKRIFWQKIVQQTELVYHNALVLQIPQVNEGKYIVELNSMTINKYRKQIRILKRDSLSPLYKQLFYFVTLTGKEIAVEFQLRRCPSKNSKLMFTLKDQRTDNTLDSFVLEQSQIQCILKHTQAYKMRNASGNAYVYLEVKIKAKWWWSRWKPLYRVQYRPPIPKEKKFKKKSKPKQKQQIKKSKSANDVIEETVQSFSRKYSAPALAQSSIPEDRPI